MTAKSVSHVERLSHVSAKVKVEVTEKEVASAFERAYAKLGREAIRIDFSVTRIVKATGATRQTIYNWFAGKPVAPYYADRVRTLLNILVSADTAENAWRKACSKFDLKT